MPVADNLVAYWSLDEASGTRNDSKNTNNLTDNNTVTSASGIKSNAAVFTAANTEFLSRTDPSDLSMGDFDFSFALWVNLNGIASNQSLLSKYTGVDFEYQINFDNALFFKFQIASATNFVNITTAIATDFGPPSATTWYFIAVRHDATANTIDIGVNGGTQTSTGYSAGGWDGPSTFILGNNNDSQLLDGMLDEVGVWKKKLTTGEIAWLYNAGAGRSYSDIVAEGSGAALTVGLQEPVIGSSLF